MKKLAEGDVFDQVNIDFDTRSDIAAINFVLKVTFFFSLNVLDVIRLLRLCKDIFFADLMVSFLGDCVCLSVVVQEEETGAWYQHRGRDFKVPLVDYLQHDGNVIGTKSTFGLWPGCGNHYDYRILFTLL